MKRRQAGLVLPALILVLLLGALAMAFARQQSRIASQVRQQQTTVARLAEARRLLLEYAQSYHLTHPGQSTGYLLCPDTDNDGAAELSCGSAGDFAIGRLPYRTLGTVPLRDGFGECLWYAVAGNFKYNPKSAPLNWDTAGQFIVRNPDGSARHPTQRPTDYAVAVVFAPGPPLGAQHRVFLAGQPCNGPSDASLAIAQYLEGAYAAGPGSPMTITVGRLDSDTDNDQVAWLAASDVFDARLRTRSDTADLIGAVLTDTASALAPLPDPEGATTLIGNVIEGAPPVTAYNDRASPWSDQFRYLKCTTGTACMTLDDRAGHILGCAGLLLFAGTARGTQNRPAGGDPAYFEDNVSALQAPETDVFWAAHDYATTAPAQDLARCLPAP
ncbi:hypothetical protein G3580_14900 [Nitrogeniibacter mangrovi]|uniref:Uncharacterized protein n=1 Tax=Nitrogeniibacter mangrovi TaxID=2016596 RepID=A0A6C1B7K3_9RHOO|nr:hypothetical protein [Nitrogeniibacter mangrovi]QID18795.1 hypothetical protein G3580_14900 [Nitrogeniibacter mangrovi]